MLMNLLPGLRDLRAPLAAGYLWLVGMWLLLVDIFPPRRTATGVAAHVYALSQGLGRGTVLAAVSFTAYLIGVVLSVNADGLIVNILSLFAPSTGIRRKQYSNFLRRLGEIDARLAGASGRVSARIVNDIDILVQRIRNDVPPVDPMGLELSEIENEIIEQWNESLQSRTVEGSVSWANRVWIFLNRSMLYSLTSEMRQLVTRLRVSSPPLFDQYDRARGEAEFRLSVAFPLVFIAGVLAWKWTPLWLFLLPGVALIIQSGMRRAREATDVVGQAVLTGYVVPSRWARRDASPSTVAYQALNMALLNPPGYFYPDDIEKIKYVLKILPEQPPEKPPDVFP